MLILCANTGIVRIKASYNSSLAHVESCDSRLEEPDKLDYLRGTCCNGPRSGVYYTICDRKIRDFSTEIWGGSESTHT